VPPGALLSELAVGELGDDVEVAEVAGVLLEQVKQDPLECRGIGSVPPVARLATVSKIMGFHDGPGAGGLGVQHRHQSAERLSRSDVPVAIPVVTPGIGDIAALEPPLQPAQLVIGKVLEQLDRVQPDGSRLTCSSAVGRASSLLTSRERK
jgi:hypothetical protein